jgi:hypothetical protein
MNELLDGPAECLVFACILLYPDGFAKLINKIAKQQLNTDLRKSWFKGN